MSGARLNVNATRRNIDDKNTGSSNSSKFNTLIANVYSGTHIEMQSYVNNSNIGNDTTGQGDHSLDISDKYGDDADGDVEDDNHNINIGVTSGIAVNSNIIASNNDNDEFNTETWMLMILKRIKTMKMKIKTKINR